MIETGYKAPRWDAGASPTAIRTAVTGAPSLVALRWTERPTGNSVATAASTRRSAIWHAGTRHSAIAASSPTPAVRKFMTGYVNEGPGGLSKYAYGWAVMKTSRGTRLVTHNGGNGVYVAEFLRFVDDRVTIFVTSTVSELTATTVVRSSRGSSSGCRTSCRPRRCGPQRPRNGGRHLPARRRQSPGVARPGRPVDGRSRGPAGVRTAHGRRHGLVTQSGRVEREGAHYRRCRGDGGHPSLGRRSGRPARHGRRRPPGTRPHGRSAEKVGASFAWWRSLARCQEWRAGSRRLSG